MNILAYSQMQSVCSGLCTGYGGLKNGSLEELASVSVVKLSDVCIASSLPVYIILAKCLISEFKSVHAYVSYSEVSGRKVKCAVLEVFVRKRVSPRWFLLCFAFSTVFVGVKILQHQLSNLSINI